MQRAQAGREMKAPIGIAKKRQSKSQKFAELMWKPMQIGGAVVGSPPPSIPAAPQPKAAHDQRVKWMPIKPLATSGALPPQPPPPAGM